MDYHDKYFEKQEIVEKFSILRDGTTFAEIDVADVFHRQVPAKGILGCVIEQSVLGMKQNSLQEADLSILQDNGEYSDTELKVTGVQESKKEGFKYSAKEPMSLTAVSIGTIEHEVFEESHFYKKIAHMLFVFYLYSRKKGQKVVPYTEYDRFPIIGYKFLDIADDAEELARFQNDWTITQQFIIEANQSNNPEYLYPLLHQTIKDRLFYIDIAPRYKKSPKQSPRFRFKQSYVDTIFQQFFNEKKKLERLPLHFNSFEDLEQKLHAITEQYKGKTIEELANIFCIQKPSVAVKVGEPIPRARFSKQISEMVVVKMLGGKSRKISDIELFSKIGLLAKTITITKKGVETEQMKLFTMDLDEITDTSIEYEDTSYYEYFSNHQMLCIMFEEPSLDAPLNDNVFLGFKRLSFNDEMLYGTIKAVYKDICDKINNNGVVESYMYLEDGTQRINETGVPMATLNFPKQKDSDIFVRGTSSDSTYKPWVFKGQAADGSNIIHTYSQQIWIKGRYITDMLKDKDFI